MTTENQLEKAWHFRHACKEFDDTKHLSSEQIDFILEGSRLSPSSFGIEPWHFIVVQTAKMKESIAKSSPWNTVKILTCSAVIITLTRNASALKENSNYIKNLLNKHQANNSKLMEHMFKEYKNYLKFSNPSDEKLFDWAEKNTYIAVANMVTACAYIGLDSCIIGGFDNNILYKELKNNPKADVKQLTPSLLIAVGYRKDSNQPKKIRQTQKEVTTYLD